PIPGHSPDMLGLYEKNKGWFFSADVWVREYIRFFMRPESMKTQIASLKRVRELDFEVLLCSHNPQFENAKEKIQQKIDFLEDFYGQVARLDQKGLSPQAIMKEMQIKEYWELKILSGGFLSAINMVKSVIRDEKNQTYSLL
ncbi:MAG: MBL fold metallo-hydrolase, partial [Bacteroidota bacterium]